MNQCDGSNKYVLDSIISTPYSGAKVRLYCDPSFEISLQLENRLILYYIASFFRLSSQTNELVKVKNSPPQFIILSPIRIKYHACRIVSPLLPFYIS